ncbi:DUF2235 domain-containing protein [Sphaerotilus mobilis]|uniref:Uncharacterized protein (DUF2235 family) n=1 Tax=Sphaerotilus mobilis TaxID=47994 RepID=A0A4Q7LQP4_9BURK|nr:DUF2235 domain-containing protein [Sphaerotilus mobilis]RZS56994.1 uncharacterized protein (DUF2235 family) [Sphaerotilus mobilis]
MPKTLVFCADGTWNGPDDDDAPRPLVQPDDLTSPVPEGPDEKERKQDGITNVLKLYQALDGVPVGRDEPEADEQEKVLTVDGVELQRARYIHGVGDAGGPISTLFGGTFGAGIIKRIVRGYTFLSRHYEPGDAIVIIGFSRGAYTARALAGLVAGQGLLRKGLTQPKEAAYQAGAKAWYRHRQNRSQDVDWRARLAESLAHIGAFFDRDALTDKDFVPVPSIRAVAVWDTVGSLGLPDYQGQIRRDRYQFADNALSPKVEHGLHAVARGERRVDFTPTLWDASHPNIRQLQFAGAHADVGGGYPAGEESGLSNIALNWMAGELRALGVSIADDLAQCHPGNPLGPAHQPWKAPMFRFSSKADRPLDAVGVARHPSVEARHVALAGQPEPLA